MLIFEESDSVVSNWRKSIMVWRPAVGSLENGLDRLIDSGGGDGVEKHAATMSQNRDGMFLSVMIALII